MSAIDGQYFTCIHEYLAEPTGMYVAQISGIEPVLLHQRGGKRMQDGLPIISCSCCSMLQRGFKLAKTSTTVKVSTKDDVLHRWVELTVVHTSLCGAALS